MNAWVPKLIKAGQAVRITAGGAGKLAIGNAGTLPTTVETSWDGGQNWHEVTTLFGALIADELLTLAVPIAGDPAPLLGSQIRCDQDFYLMQED